MRATTSERYAFFAGFLFGIAFTLIALSIYVVAKAAL